jgi:hypothetical protein
VQPNYQTPAKADPQKLVVGPARLSYCHLDQPRPNRDNPDAPPKYSVTLLIPKSDVATRQRIDAAIAAAIEDGIKGVWRGARPQFPSIVWDGDGLRRNGLPFGPECKGHWVMTASSKDKPGVVGPDRAPIINPTEIYSGCYGYAQVRFYAFARSGNLGIGCALNHVMKIRDGEPLSGRESPDEAFAAIPATYAAPQYQQPAIPQVPVQPQMPYQPVQPYQPQQPAPAQPQYQQPAPQGYAPQGYAPNSGTTGAPQPQVGINPLTGQPMGGSVMGVNINPATGLPF